MSQLVVMKLSGTRCTTRGCWLNVSSVRFLLNVVTETSLVMLLRNKRGACTAYPPVGGYIAILIVESSVQKAPADMAQTLDNTASET
jgi:hypothetical protein